METYREANIPARIYNSDKKELSKYGLGFFEPLLSINSLEEVQRLLLSLQTGHGLNFLGNSNQCLDVFYAYLCQLLEKGIGVGCLSIFDIARILEGKASSHITDLFQESSVIGIYDFYMETYDGKNPLENYHRYDVQNYILENIGNRRAFVIFGATTSIPTKCWDKVLLETLNEYNINVDWGVK